MISGDFRVMIRPAFLAMHSIHLTQMEHESTLGIKSSFLLSCADQPDASPVPQRFGSDRQQRREPTVDEQPRFLPSHLGPAPMATSGSVLQKDVYDKAKNLGHRTPAL
jgi:hypothetical protein